MSDGWVQDRSAALGLALLRATLVAVIVITEQLVDARRLAGIEFYLVLGIAAAYAAIGIVISLRPPGSIERRQFGAVAPWCDVLLLSSLACTSAGAFSDVRKAFFVIPLAAAFSERPFAAAKWSLIAVASFTVQAAIAGGHPPGTENSWARMTLNQDLYLAWTGAAATMLALTLRRRSAHTEELARSRQRLVTQAIESVERERTRLAGALHDSPVQNLIAARHDLRRAERSGDPDSFRRLHDAIDVSITQLREEIFNLHPHVLDHVGLEAALEQVAQRQAADRRLRVDVEVDHEAGDRHRQILFALGRELLINAAKHAEASEITLRLTPSPQGARLEVADDGCGIPQGRMREALLEGHIGLASVAERVGGLGGTLTIDTTPESGTRIVLTLPDARDDHRRQRRAADVSDRVTRGDTLGFSTP